MRDKVLRWCQAQALLAPGQTVVCAVSGGADSVAMLHVLLELREEMNFEVSAAHFNHQLRGAEADRDEAFVREICEKWGVSLTIGTGNVRARMAESGASLEEAARQLRYEFFSTLDGVVATAHTADDNVETVLLNLIRGTGLRGLAGIPPKREGFIRPMLCLTRNEIEAYLAENGIFHIEDSTNAEDSCLRNRLRHSVVPLLKLENPSLAATLLREGSLLRQEDDFLENCAEKLLKMAETSDGWRCDALQSAPEALQCRAVRLRLKSGIPPGTRCGIHAAHVTALVRLTCEGGPSASVSLPGGWRAIREYDRVRLLPPGDANMSFCPFTIRPGQETEIPELGLRVRCAKTKNFSKKALGACTFACRCDMIEQDGTFVVRPRKSGDTLRLCGGTKSLKKRFIDRKIPAAQRLRIPVFADARGVVAVEGIGVDLDRRAVEGEAAVLFTLEKIREKEEQVDYD